MRCNLKNVTVRFAPDGEGDWQFRTKTWLILRDGRNLELSSEWDLTPFVGEKVKEGMISIPSGTLEFWIPPRVRPPEIEVSKDHYLGVPEIMLHFPRGKWHGKYGGVSAGQTGHALFDATITSIEESTFLLPEEQAITEAQWIGRKKTVDLLQRREELKAAIEGSPPPENWATQAHNESNNGNPNWWWEKIRSIKHAPCWISLLGQTREEIEEFWNLWKEKRHKEFDEFDDSGELDDFDTFLDENE